MFTRHRKAKLLGGSAVSSGAISVDVQVESSTSEPPLYTSVVQASTGYLPGITVSSACIGNGTTSTTICVNASDFEPAIDIPTLPSPAPDTPTITKILLNTLEGVQCGVPTLTTPTLTPTTLRNIQQTFFEASQQETHSNQAGFEPPLVNPYSEGLSAAEQSVEAPSYAPLPGPPPRLLPIGDIYSNTHHGSSNAHHSSSNTHHSSNSFINTSNSYINTSNSSSVFASNNSVFHSNARAGGSVIQSSFTNALSNSGGSVISSTAADNCSGGVIVHGGASNNNNNNIDANSAANKSKVTVTAIPTPHRRSSIIKFPERSQNNPTEQVQPSLPPAARPKDLNLTSLPAASPKNFSLSAVGRPQTLPLPPQASSMVAAPTSSRFLTSSTAVRGAPPPSYTSVLPSTLPHPSALPYASARPSSSWVVARPSSASSRPSSASPMPSYNSSSEDESRLSVDSREEPVRRGGGRRPNNSEQLTEEEEHKRNLRRERNKMAAARCRKRRLDQTLTLQEETNELDKRKEKLKAEIEKLQRQKEEMSLLLASHRPHCSMALRRGSMLDHATFGGSNVVVTTSAGRQNPPTSAPQPQATVGVLRTTASASIPSSAGFPSQPPNPSVIVKEETTSDNEEALSSSYSGSLFSTLLTSSSPALPRPLPPAYPSSSLPPAPTPRPRPTSLAVGPITSLAGPITDIGVPIETPSVVLRGLNFDSMLEGGSGLTPVTPFTHAPPSSTGLTPLTTPVTSLPPLSSYPHCSNRSPDSMSQGSKQLVSL